MTAMPLPNSSSSNHEQSFKTSVDLLSNQVKSICSLYHDKDRSVDMQKKLEELYLEGLKWITAEVKGQPLSSFVPTNVVTELHQLKWNSLINRNDIHASLSKVYRVFLELVLARAKRTLKQEVKDDFSAEVKKNLALTPDHIPSIHFEYECSRQAITALAIPVDTLDKYFIPFGQVAWHLHTASYASVLQDSIALITPSLNKWYADVRNLRWKATTIKSLEEFQQIISPSYDTFRQQGRQYTLGLAAICVDLILNPGVEEGVKREASRDLVTLGQLKDDTLENSWKGYFSDLIKKTGEKVSSETIVKYGKECDKYYTTRLLINEYFNRAELHLKSLHIDVDKGRNPDQPSYIEDADVIRQKKVQPESFTGLIHERQLLEQKRKEIEGDISAMEQFIQPTRDTSLSPEKQALRYKDVTICKEELETVYKDRREVEQQIEQLKMQFIQDATQLLAEAEAQDKILALDVLHIPSTS